MRTNDVWVNISHHFVTSIDNDRIHDPLCGTGNLLTRTGGANVRTPKIIPNNLLETAVLKECHCVTMRSSSAKTTNQTNLPRSCIECRILSQFLICGSCNRHPNIWLKMIWLTSLSGIVWTSLQSPLRCDTYLWNHRLSKGDRETRSVLYEVLSKSNIALLIAAFEDWTLSYHVQYSPKYITEKEKRINSWGGEASK